MIWDTGAQMTFITEELLSDWFRQHLQSPEHNPYRGDNHTYVKIDALVGFSNSPIEISAIACVKPRHLMPNNLLGVIFGQQRCIDSLCYMNVPRNILVSRGEEVEDGVWGDIILYGHADILGEFRRF